MKYLIIIITITVCFTSCKENTKEPTDERVAVNIAHPQSLALANTISSSGIITSVEDLTLSFKVSGMVQQTLIDEGDYVKAGQLLASLNTTELDEQLRQANLNVSKLARDDKRLEALVKDTIATLEDLQNTQTALQTAQSQKQSILYNINQSRLYAPKAGIVRSKQINTGEFKQAGSPAYIVGNNSGNHKWVFRIALSDKDRVKLSLNQSTSIVLDALPDRDFNGKIIKLDNVPDEATGTYNCYVSMDSEDKNLVFGLTGHLVTETHSQKEEGAILPTEALFNINNNTANIYLLQKDSTVHKQQVHISGIKDDKASILEPLPASASIITSGKTFLNEGTKVKVVQP